MSKNRREVLNQFLDMSAYAKNRIETGIENNRKGFAKVVLKDKNGNPLNG